jgi:PPOX class probable F420-dependent enzyme
MSLAMSRAEREAFLAATHVGIVSIAEAGRGPLSVPVWYRYEPGGEVRFATGDASRKAELLRRAGRASLCVQTETPPYRYVSVEGPTTIEQVDFERDTREMALRYLGPRMGEAYLAATYPNGTSREVIVRLRPERWWSADFRKFGAHGSR